MAAFRMKGVVKPQQTPTIRNERMYAIGVGVGVGEGAGGLDCRVDILILYWGKVGGDG